MKPVLVAAALGALTLTLLRAPAELPKPAAPRADALDLLLHGEKPERLELRVSVDGKSVPAIWDDTFAALHDYFDRDGNRSLDKTEAARLPSAFALRQLLWGQVTPFTGPAPPFAELDTDKDDKVSGDELVAFYRTAGLGNVLVGVGKPPATEQLTAALLRHLDADKSGTVSEAEWTAAADTLLKLDANGDELVGPGELVERVAYPGAHGANLLSPPTPTGKPDALGDVFPLTVLPLRTADTHWATAVAVRREKEKLDPLTAVELLGLRTGKPLAAWQVRFAAGKNAAGTLAPVVGKPPANARLALAVGSLRLELRSDDGQLAEQATTARKRFEAQFAECDANADGSLDAGELAVPKAALFKHLLAAADRDGDGTLSGKEFAAWLGLQDQIVRGHVLLTVLDHGAGLFELLDRDRDGSLSVRELRTAWDRLKAAGCIADGKLDRAKLPRTLLAAISRGHPRSPLGKPVRAGPVWFQAMDRNGDGDVSRSEFTGPATVFAKFDADQDGLLSADEAAQAR